MRLNLLISSLLIALTASSSFLPLHIPSIHPLSRRQVTTSPRNKPSKFLSAARLETLTINACTTFLSRLSGRPTSPSGISLCYNVPILNTTTGAFRADLRLFKVAEPRGEWKNVRARDMVPSVRWVGARVGNMRQGKRRVLEDDHQDGSGQERRDRGLGKRAEGDTLPGMIISYIFVGQINADAMGKPMNASMLQRYLLPIISLSVPGLNSITLLTTEASFLPVASPQLSTGVFIPLTSTPFALPGTKIAQVPIGGIITGTWAIVLVGMLGWGAVEKMRFREHYRRRVAMDKARTTNLRRL